ncbi:NACHT domain-containing protein [Billgrantia endophytica]|uniref:Uncharacterized protein n=1 Tax=Billgrantia endophytica TaxID=2033802 RepID=A0A2N7U4E6_9GAMM|nr:hypothetical protein [Halomonas endophytica]PMR75302.1 hypothetical protein C1H69_10275 [Halomonas endophytica]
MPALNWEIFKGLPASAENNFELLCRGIVRLKFGRFGVFRALANQPGVEFHLKLDERCESLGDPGRWWGWQCKWYDLAANGALGATRRAKIEEGIRKTEAHLPGLTDWVLWTRRTLTKKDQEWFNGLSSRMNLHLWTGDEIDNLLSGQATVLRNTYFGELVLTPDILRELHEQAVAPIRARWQPNVHHVGEAERELCRMLGESESWDVLRVLSRDLRATTQTVENSPPVPPLLAPLVSDVVATARQSADTLDRVAEGISSGDLDLLRDELRARPHVLPEIVATTPRRLRAGNHRAGLYATNAVAGCHDTVRALGDVESAFSSRIVAVLAPAGCGKTHLAAQLTAGAPARPHGVLLHGRDLHANHTLDDLARRVSIAAQPVPSMESLLAAVDAAGQRARHRLPILIDGLNESEEPRIWKPLLASLETTLAKYPYVLLVCTLRPEFVDDALPHETRRVEIIGYGSETIEAIREHFRHWKIDATDVSLPVELLEHPLTLRLFCEVTNPTRKKVVGVSAMPGSLTALFERYLEQVSVRVVELASRAHRFYGQDVNAALSKIANKMWESRTRVVEFDELRNLLGDAQRPWDQSLVRALEHEGVLLRMPSNGNDAFVPVYDLLGGHIIANALLATHGQISFGSWINTPDATTSLAGDYEVRHPLAEDIVLSLVGQVPRRFPAEQLWQMVDVPLRGHALRLAAYLEPASLDALTVDALLELVCEGDAGLLERLWEVRGMQGHPLNAEALDRALRTMTVSDRDLRWTEWLRRNADDVLARGHSVIRDLKYLEERWRSEQVRTGDRLRVRWVMWTLTSTVRRLRDQATCALYWFGRVDPEGLFTLTIDSLTVNDAYVGERMLAASYGVVMSHQRTDAQFALILKTFLEQLASSLVGTSATAPTHHYLARLYVRGIVVFAAKFYTSSLPPSLSATWSFATPAPVQPLVKGAPGADEAGQTLHMDFENYTLGKLFDDRRNYDMNHTGHQAAVAHVRGVVRALGWRKATFERLDSRIDEDAYRYGRGNQPPAERYGKKYGWIGYFTYAGVLEERGQFPRENHPFSDVDIDPSFPETPPTDGDTSVPEAWLLPNVKRHENWIRTTTTSMPLSLLRRDSIGEFAGPWFAVHGFVKAADHVLGREAWAFISAFVTDKMNAPSLCAALEAGTRPRRAGNVPNDHYVFADEIPWHPNFAFLALDEDAYRENVLIGTDTVNVEVLAHEYAWESYHSEMNRAGSTRVPSNPFSARFDLRSAPQSFDQFLPDGTRATITLGGVDGFDADILYVREDLLEQYVGERTIVWFVFGERELRPYPSSQPEWLLEASRQQENAWCEVLTDADLKQNAKVAGRKR